MIEIFSVISILLPCALSFQIISVVPSAVRSGSPVFFVKHENRLSRSEKKRERESAWSQVTYALVKFIEQRKRIFLQDFAIFVVEAPHVFISPSASRESRAGNSPRNVHWDASSGSHRFRRSDDHWHNFSTTFYMCEAGSGMGFEKQKSNLHRQIVTRCCLIITTLCCTSSVSCARLTVAKPSATQAKYLDYEIGASIHFNMQTFNRNMKPGNHM